MSIGTILNINPKGALKASTTVATAATKTLTHMAQKEAVDVAATVASKNVSKATPWFKSFNPYSQVTQKTSQVAEKCLVKEGILAANQTSKETANLLFNSWDKGTFPNRMQSIKYHLQKHGNGKSSKEYTQAALTFLKDNRDRAMDVTLKNGRAGFSIKLKQNGQRMGGFWTENEKIITYWD
jgi:hypothetical protein